MASNLTICIPTYNRKISLSQCLDSFINDASKYEVKICISDNNSNDGTMEMIQCYRDKFPNLIEYEYREFNEGLDKNMLYVLEMAKTDYALWLGSDDVLTPNALPTILEHLNREVDLFLLPIEQFKIKPGYTYKDPFSFFEDFGMLGLDGSMHFSSMIVRTDLIRSITNKERYLGTLHMYAGCVLDYLLNQYTALGVNSIYVLPLGLWIPGTKDKSWSNDIFSVYLDYIPYWCQMLPSEYRSNDKVLRRINEYRKRMEFKLSFLTPPPIPPFVWLMRGICVLVHNLDVKLAVIKCMYGINVLWYTLLRNIYRKLIKK